MKWGNIYLFLNRTFIHRRNLSITLTFSLSGTTHLSHLWHSPTTPLFFFPPLPSLYMTHSSSLLPLPQRDYIHTHTDNFSPGAGFVPTAALSSLLKHTPAEMQQGHFTAPQSPSALLRLLKHREARPSPAIWEFQKCTLIFHSSCIFFLNVRFKQPMV